MTKHTYNYTCLVNYCNKNNITLIKDYSNINVTRDTYLEGFCQYDNCELIFNKTFRQVKKTEGSGVYCELCTKIIKMKKTKETCMNKYGVEHCLQVKEIREAGLNTIKEKYGVDNISQSEEIKQRKYDTCMSNFGVGVSFKSPEIKNKIKNRFIEKYNVDNPLKSKEIQNQIENTNLEKYGVKNPQQCAEIKLKTENTCLQKYGVKSSILISEVIQKRKQSCIEKYGNEIPLKTELGKQIIKQTCLEKYGVENPQQNPEIAEKSSKNSFRKKTYILPSGKELLCQGYEPFALDKLLNEDKICEEDIVTGCKNVPQIWYNDDNGKKHRHYIDIFIPSQNRCIEIKSTWTAEKKKDNIYLKQNAGKELGYNYEIWIYNNKKALVEVIL